MSIPSTSDLERATGYLAQISPDIERGEWVKVLMALKNTFGDGGELMARGWSANSDKFKPQDFRDTWQSLDHGGAIGLGSLAHLSGHQPTVKVSKPARSSTQDYALKLWDKAEWGSTASHPYAVTKKISHDFGAKRGTASGRILGKDADCIIVPMRTWDGELIGVECINADGAKQTFGKKGLLLLGHPEGAEQIHVCEGWATAYALAQMFPFNYACVVAFGSKVMETAQQALSRYEKLITAHNEDSDNKDAWDYWAAGRADEYRELVNANA